MFHDVANSRERRGGSPAVGVRLWACLAVVVSGADGVDRGAHGGVDAQEGDDLVDASWRVDPSFGEAGQGVIDELRFGGVQFGDEGTGRDDGDAQWRERAGGEVPRGDGDDRVGVGCERGCCDVASSPCTPRSSDLSEGPVAVVAFGNALRMAAMVCDRNRSGLMSG